MTKKIAFLFFFFSTFLSLAFSEKYRIGDVVYNLEGITKEYALSQKVPISTEKTFENREELENYKDDILQQLINLRFAKEVSAEIEEGLSDDEAATNEDTSDEKTDEETKTVTFKITASDSKHLLVLPYPKYDNNSGFSGKIKIKDANFLGSLNEMNAEIFVDTEKKEEGRIDEIKKPTIGAKFAYNHPFPLGIFNSSWNNEFQFNFNLDEDEPNLFEFAAKTGITLYLPINERISFIQDYSFKAALDNYFAEQSLDNGFNFDDAMYYTGVAELSLPFKILEMQNFGALTYNPFIKYEHTFDDNGISDKNEDLISPFLSTGQKFTFGRINWIGNFRDGIEASSTQSIGYNFGKNDGENLVLKIDVEAKAFKSFKYIAIASDLYYFQILNGRAKIGERLRGIMDNQFYANIATYSLKTKGAITLNLDFPIRIVKTDWQKLFKNWNWVKYFDFELQLVPFFDMALTHNEETERTFHPKDGFYAAGLEVLVFPLHWKNIVVRASVGFDLSDSIFKNALEQNFRNAVSHHEIHIGIGLHY